MSEQAQNQIALWEQRLLRGKLHLAGAGPNAPLCGRQLNNHRVERSQQADRIELAQSMEEFTYQLLSRKGCRHCAQKAGLLVRTVTVREPNEDEEPGDDE